LDAAAWCLCGVSCWYSVADGQPTVEEVLVDLDPGLFTVGKGDFEGEPV
jgi:hypothetical protein